MRAVQYAASYPAPFCFHVCLKFAMQLVLLNNPVIVRALSTSAPNS